MTDFAITGRLARFGRGGMIQDISNKLLRTSRPAWRRGWPRATRRQRPESAAGGAQVAAGEAPPEAAAPAPGGAPAASGGEVAAGEAAPEAAAPAGRRRAGGERRRGRDRSGGARGGRAPRGSGVTVRRHARRRAAPELLVVVFGSAARGGRSGRRGPRSRPRRPASNEPLKVGGLFWSVLWERIKRLFGGGRK